MGVSGKEWSRRREQQMRRPKTGTQLWCPWSSKGASMAGVGDRREQCEERNLGQQGPDYAGPYMSQ